MPTNVEVKVKVDSLVPIRELAGGEVKLIEQIDTFFKSNNGRLKLREFKINEEAPEMSQKAELIWYQREDTEGIKISRFEKMDITEIEVFKRIMAATNGILGKLIKTRHLIKIGQTRIHLDEVVGLGSFVELEVCLSDDQTLEEGYQIANEVMEKLQISHCQQIAGAYFDLQ